jgi:hypothetical protein
MYKTLTTKQKRFVENHVTKGISIAESVRRAGYQVKSGRSEDYGSLGCRMLKTERVSDYVTKLKRKAFLKDSLSLEEKRAFLASVVRSSPSQVNADSPLCQEYAEEVDQQGNVKRKVKLVSKIEAIRTDNNMSGDNFADRQDQSQVNPFLFLVNFFTPSPGSAVLPGSAVTAVLPPVLEAEIVPPSTP